MFDSIQRDAGSAESMDTSWMFWACWTSRLSLPRLTKVKTKGNIKQKTGKKKKHKQHHKKGLLSSFHLSGRTLGFDPQTEKLEPPYSASAYYTEPEESTDK